VPDTPELRQASKLTVMKASLVAAVLLAACLAFSSKSEGR